MIDTLKITVLIISISFLIIPELIGQSASDLRGKAEDYYRTEQYDRAEEYYRKSLGLERSPETLFNLGNALYKQGRFDEAAEFFEASRELLGRSGQRADAWYNYGNARFEEMDFESAIEAYRNALLDQPEHHEARNNLLLSKMLLEQMQSQEQQQTAQTGDFDSGEYDDWEFMDAPDQQPEEGEGEMEGTIAERDQPEDGESLESDDDPLEQISDQRLQQLLQIAEQDDQQARRKMNERQSDRGQSLRDW
ncbi:MAG: tetratricopeptide repeat protein [Saprospirales bacterium]|nr:MAG: tetratricopeptide repeat protein [Saprospirales bacterium]